MAARAARAAPRGRRARLHRAARRRRPRRAGARPGLGRRARRPGVRRVPRGEAPSGGRRSRAGRGRAAGGETPRLPARADRREGPPAVRERSSSRRRLVDGLTHGRGRARGPATPGPSGAARVGPVQGAGGQGIAGLDFATDIAIEVTAPVEVVMYTWSPAFSRPGSMLNVAPLGVTFTLLVARAPSGGAPPAAGPSNVGPPDSPFSVWKLCCVPPSGAAPAGSGGGVVPSPAPWTLCTEPDAPPAGGVAPATHGTPPAA